MKLSDFDRVAELRERYQNLQHLKQPKVSRWLGVRAGGTDNAFTTDLTAEEMSEIVDRLLARTVKALNDLGVGVDRPVEDATEL